MGRASRDLHELANRSAAYAGLFSRAPYGKIVMQDQWQEAAANAYPRVYRALVALGASPEDASDALQDAFERGLRRSRSDARAIDRPDAWLFVVALTNNSDSISLMLKADISGSKTRPVGSGCDGRCETVS